MRIDAARRLLRGDDRLGISDGRIHADDVGTHLCQQGPHLGPLRTDRIAIAEWRTRFAATRRKMTFAFSAAI
jgi:hypothetical protein